MQKTLYPLLFGGDINVYSVARAFHEAYGLRSSCFGKYPSGPAYDSKIIDYHTCAENEDPDVFYQNVVSFAQAHADGQVLIIACGDSYVKLAALFRDRFPPNVIAPYDDWEKIGRLIDKEQFYALCDEHGIDHPATFIHRAEIGHDFTLPFPPPYICKPSDGVDYWAHPFEGNEKVFLRKDMDSLCAVLDKIYASGYGHSVIVQEFIPGDDADMRVLTNYSNAAGQVKMMCLGHVLLEEHTPHGSGNHAVILTERNEALCEKLRGFLEAIQFIGFSNFDMKYDARDGTFKVFEINCRQGRSNYYVTAAGQNVARWVVSDRVLGEDGPAVVSDAEILMRVVPGRVARRYIRSAFHPAMRALARAGKVYNPLFYKPDNGITRRLRLIKNWASHFWKYKKYGTRKS